MATRVKYTTPVVKLALERKWISEQQLNECKDLLRKSTRIGLESTMEEILLKQGLLNRQQLDELTELSDLAEKGSLFGAYRLGEMLGKGGMGKVYEAVHEMMNREVAVKVLNYNYTRDQNNLSRFLQEIRALAKLNHVNIVQIFDAGKVKRRYFFAMELVDGVSLQRKVEQDGFLPEREVLRLIRQTAQALAYAHKNSVIHRDVKPENILLDKSGDAKLTDFGVVMHQDADHMTLTKEGFMVGSVYYASPEQVQGERNIDGRCDIYSLGATFYFALTGRTVYTGSNSQEILRKHVFGNWVSPRRYNKKISRSTAGIVKKMMNRNRDKRFQSMEDVIKAIDNWGKMQKFTLILLVILLSATILVIAGMAIEMNYEPLKLFATYLIH
ncbi:MAG: serine/threonine protein kinase [Fibrobacterota bacterium]